ncbi:hypothetical protein IAE19_11270 [Acinetobacter sp. S40]|uniref:hypothetical protein n=1 Tax=unclassified Acinetobacter TaxID=196816 RepID=UPI00190C7300|nr:MULTISPECIES: hypothetical protein [unclassified Acinetobacter]MBJ9986015.1 hypothetical protein [Acinetobacter sp. S40]MBK0063987.1 hypothetical protein [Acinetobacter sp. S55]MBK0067272.1 hypothetical protein [Acinetobacter sp. S54]
MKKVLQIILIMIVLTIIYYLFLQKRFDSDLLMKDNSTIIKLSNLTNFSWDYALISLSNEDFEKITFYKNGAKLYKDGFKVDYEGEVKSQYLFAKEGGANYYKCQNFASIKLKRIERFKDQNRIFYIYEPLDCIPVYR